MPRTLMATSPLITGAGRSFIAVSLSHGMQSCPAGRGSCSSRSTPDRFVVAGVFVHQILEILWHEQVASQRLLDEWLRESANLVYVQTLDAERTARVKRH